MRPLFHPAIEDIRPDAILHALSDPVRAAIFAQISGRGCVPACSALATVGGKVVPKSSLSHHMRVLREAGLIRCERQGVEMRNHSRCSEVNTRFPGLLPAVLDAYAMLAGKPDRGHS
jgi:DNA-binding transcriptional ArsR family regulator